VTGTLSTTSTTLPTSTTPQLDRVVTHNRGNAAAQPHGGTPMNHIELPGQAGLNAEQRIAAELRAKLHRPTDNTSDPARQAERVHEAERAAAVEAQQAALTPAATPVPQRMAPNPAQGSSHSGNVVEAPVTGATSAERIRQITRAKFDNAALPNQH
jgi:hypothetical protein